MRAIGPAEQTHFRVYIVADAFRGKTRIERHRMINAALAGELAGGVHALAIHANAPGEAQPKLPARMRSGRVCNDYGQRQRRVDEHAVLLRLRFRLVVLVDVLDRAFADQRARQDHDADETGRPVSGLREHRIGPASYQASPT